MPSTDLVSPGYVNGFAPRDGFPLNPNLWQGCVVALDPGLGITGTTLYDWSGRRNDGALTNLAADGWKYGERGHVVEFNATNDTCRIPYDANYASTRYSWSIWVKSTETGGNLGLISRWQNVGGTYSWVVTWENTGIYWYQAGLTTVSAGGLSQNDGKWHHLAGTYDKVRTILYLDGKAVYDIANTGDYTATVQPIYIGGYAGGQDWDGQWRAFGIWNRALLANEVRQLASDPAAMYRMEPRRLPASVPTFILSGSITGDAGSISGSLEFAPPVFDLTGSINGDAGTISGSLAFAPPVFAITGAITGDAGSIAGSLAFTPPVFALSGAITGDSGSIAGQFEFSIPEIIASGAITGSAGTIAGSLVFVPGTINLSGSIAGSAGTIAGVLSFTIPLEDNAGPGSSGIGPYGSRLRNPLTKMFKKT